MTVEARPRFIDVALEFSPAPMGRTRRQGRFSGEAFREDLLKPALRISDIVVVDLDGTSGLSTGFLDEGIAGIVRDGTIVEPEFWRRVKIISTRDPLVINDIRVLVSSATRAVAA